MWQWQLQRHVQNKMNPTICLHTFVQWYVIIIYERSISIGQTTGDSI